MNETKTFEATYPRYPFADLVRLAMALGALLARLRAPRTAIGPKGLAHAGH